MKTILCYGDSNTWGYDPTDGSRYPRDVRWTGRLQAALPEYYIVEEGLGGRTTAAEDSFRPGRCGLTYLPIALKSHDPIDLVILMLGTNDCKNRLRLSAPEIAEGVQMMIELIHSQELLHLRKAPDILVVSPPPFCADKLEHSAMRGEFGMDTVRTSHELADALRQTAERMHAHFFDAGTVTAAEADGIHLTAEGHARLAEALAENLRIFCE